MDKMVLRPTDAAKVLDISRPTLYRWMKMDGFPVIRIGGCVRIPLDDLLAWVKAQRG